MAAGRNGRNVNLKLADELAAVLVRAADQLRVGCARELDCPHSAHELVRLGSSLQWCAGCGSVRLIFRGGGGATGAGPWYNPSDAR